MAVQLKEGTIRERLERAVINAVRQAKLKAAIDRPISEYGFTVELERAANALLEFEASHAVGQKDGG